ncbi:hypothetical protein EVAR_102365_1 [Eumeta japonica]|uniref:Uncharacterized protein n=1 Tax=Eumeta variegata TaxID=151549 RepID=A0A4C1XGX8_EUMVA|nr:hypothetical protein EVAR_102365_1 [Eumeta japonica]
MLSRIACPAADRWIIVLRREIYRRPVSNFGLDFTLQALGESCRVVSAATRISDYSKSTQTADTRARRNQTEPAKVVAGDFVTWAATKALGAAKGSRVKVCSGCDRQIDVRGRCVAARACVVAQVQLGRAYMKDHGTTSALCTSMGRSP